MKSDNQWKKNHAQMGGTFNTLLDLRVIKGEKNGVYQRRYWRELEENDIDEGEASAVGNKFNNCYTEEPQDVGRSELPAEFFEIVHKKQRQPKISIYSLIGKVW